MRKFVVLAIGLCCVAVISIIALLESRGAEQPQGKPIGRYQLVTRSILFDDARTKQSRRSKGRAGTTAMPVIMRLDTATGEVVEYFAGRDRKGLEHRKWVCIVPPYNPDDPLDIRN